MCSVQISHLLFGLEDIAAENVALSIPGDVTEDLQILGIMGNVENPERKEIRSEMIVGKILLTAPAIISITVEAKRPEGF